MQCTNAILETSCTNAILQTRSNNANLRTQCTKCDFTNVVHKSDFIKAICKRSAKTLVSKLGLSAQWLLYQNGSRHLHKDSRPLSPFLSV